MFATQSAPAGGRPKLIVDEIELAVRRVQVQHPELSQELETVADALWQGEGVDLAHQAAVQSFLWCDVPRRHEPGDWAALVEATAALLDAVGYERLSDIARSAQTAEILRHGGWIRRRVRPPSGPHGRHREWSRPTRRCWRGARSWARKRPTPSVPWNWH